jgi:hypothetical protein
MSPLQRILPYSTWCGDNGPATCDKGSRAMTSNHLPHAEKRFISQFRKFEIDMERATL